MYANISYWWTTLSLKGSRGGRWGLYQLHLGEGRMPPWMSCHLVEGRLSEHFGGSVLCSPSYQNTSDVFIAPGLDLSPEWATIITSNMLISIKQLCLNAVVLLYCISPEGKHSTQQTQTWKVLLWTMEIRIHVICWSPPWDKKHSHSSHHMLFF